MLRHIMLGIALIGSGVMLAGPARAQGSCGGTGTPCPFYSTVPPVLVGTLTGRRVNSGYSVTLRDGNNNAITGRTIYIDFTSSLIIPSDLQVYPTYNDCGNGLRRIWSQTNSIGVATFDAAFTGFTNTSNVNVYADNFFGHLVLLGSCKARSTDCVTSASAGGTETTGLPDYAYFSSNMLSNPSAQETDFDLNGSTGLGDLSIFGADFTSSPSRTLRTRCIFICRR